MTSQDATQPLDTSSPSTCSRPSDTWTLSTSATSSSRYNLATRNSSRKSSSRRGSHCAHSSNNKLKCTHNITFRWPLISESRPRDVSPSSYICPPTPMCPRTMWARIHISTQVRHEVWGVFTNKTNGPVCMCEWWLWSWGGSRWVCYSGCWKFPGSYIYIYICMNP